MTIDIKVCMGSACFAKGNQENLEFIKQYVEEHNLESEVTITGALCENCCSDGPRIIVNDKEYMNVTQEKIKEVLDSYKKIMT